MHLQAMHCFFIVNILKMPQQNINLNVDLIKRSLLITYLADVQGWVLLG